jgi:hypothetical protein
MKRIGRINQSKIELHLRVMRYRLFCPCRAGRELYRPLAGGDVEFVAVITWHMLQVLLILRLGLSSVHQQRNEFQTYWHHLLCAPRR